MNELPGTSSRCEHFQVHGGHGELNFSAKVWGLSLKIIFSIHIIGYGLGLQQNYMESTWLGATVKIEK